MITEELRVGTRLRGLGRTITEADVVSFAAITGDWHPQHVDADWAAESTFGERIAHGMLVLSYSIGLMGFDPERVVALRGIDSLTFKRPVAIGESIRAEAEVEEVRPVDAENQLVTLRWRVLGADDRLALRARITILARPEGSDPGSDPRRGRDAFVTENAARDTLQDAENALYGERVLL